MEGVLVVHRFDVDVVVGLVVHRGHVRETREVGRRGRGGVAVRWQEKRRLWKPWAGDDAGDAACTARYDYGFSFKYEYEVNRGSLVCGHVGVCVLQRVFVSVCA